jgi:hypothetical protein
MRRLGIQSPDRASPDGHDSTPIPDEMNALWRHIYGEQHGLIGLFSGHREPGARQLTDTAERYFDWPHEADQAADWVADEDAEGREVYHCAHLLIAARRKKPNASRIAALWTDDDEAEPLSGVPPTAQVESSPGRMQSYYRLNRPIDPERAEHINRRLTYAMGADKGGWARTKPLRPPGTRNHKYQDAPMVRLVRLDPDAAYDPDELDRILPAAPAEASSKHRGTPHATTEPVELRAKLPRVDVDDLHVSGRIRDLIRRGWKPNHTQYRSRSEAVFAVIQALVMAGYTNATIAGVLMDERYGISERPHESGRGWVLDEIMRARQKQPANNATTGAATGAQEATGEQHSGCAADWRGSRTPRDLLAGSRSEPYIKWLWHGYVARGLVTVLAGKGKYAGKSTLLFGLLKAFQTGGCFLGERVTRTPVVYLSEEYDGTICDKMRRFDIDGDHVRFFTRANCFPRRDFASVMEDAVHVAGLLGAQVIVVDTSTFWSGLKDAQENDAGAVQTFVMDPVMEATTHGLAVVLVHHVSKGWSENLDAVRGASAVVNSADIPCLLIQRDENERLLKAESRSPATPAELYVALDKDENEYAVLERVPSGTGRRKKARRPKSRRKLSMQEKLAKLLAVCPASELGALQAKDLREAYRVKHGQELKPGVFFKHVGLLIERKQVVKTAECRYWRPMARPDSLTA